jgi:hypothetical protein
MTTTTPAFPSQNDRVFPLVTILILRTPYKKAPGMSRGSKTTIRL